MVLSTAFLATGLLAAVAEAKTLWSSSPAKYSNVIREAYPLGNGRLGAMSFGAAGAEKVNLNLDSLWSGGPFELADYTGNCQIYHTVRLTPNLWVAQVVIPRQTSPNTFQVS